MIVGFQLQMYDFSGLLVEHKRFEQVLHWINLTTLPLALSENQKKKLKEKHKDYIVEHSDSLVVIQRSYCSACFMAELSRAKRAQPSTMGKKMW